MVNLKQLLFDLINFPSITPNDAGCIHYLENILKQHGFITDKQIFGINNDDKVTNLYARLGNISPNICFAGHIDVVPPGDITQWHSDPFVAVERSGKIYGRGAVDMKGGVAASLAATLDFINHYPKFKGSISFLITSDEEGPAEHGTKKMLEYLQQKKEKIDLVVLGEPTSYQTFGDQIKIGRRGSVNFTLKIYGEQGHVAYPERCKNPINNILKITNDLVNYVFDQGTEYFSPSRLEVTSIDVANPTSNIIPNVAIAKFNIRFNNLHTSESLVKKVVDLIESYTMDYELKYHSSAESFIQQPNEVLLKFLQVVKKSANDNAKFSTTGGTSDARFIYSYYPVVECGPLNEMAHKINEFIENNDLQKLYKMYYDTLYRFLNGQD